MEKIKPGEISKVIQQRPEPNSVPPSERSSLMIGHEWPEPGVPIGSTIENEKQKQVIKRLVTALEFYADPQYWGKMWGGFIDENRLWVGPGPGRELAQRALEETKEDRDDR